MPLKKSSKRTCEMRVKVPEYGPFEARVIKGHEVGCKQTLDKLNPVRGTFWKKHLKTD